MIVDCPECAARYELPEALIGPRGARVHCPGCGGRFDVTREPTAPVADRPTDSAASAPVPAAPVAAVAPAAGSVPATLAREAVESLASRAPSILAAQTRGRLFAEAGAVLLEAFDEYRRRAGPAASGAAFREALRERWGIEVPGIKA